MPKTDHNHPPLPSPDLEQSFGDESMGKKRGPGLYQKCCISVLSRTHRLTDEDGRSIKAAVDGLREAGILEDDSPEFVKKISQSQERTTGDEETIIEIVWEEEPGQ